jgi:hypothetical protein
VAPGGVFCLCVVILEDGQQGAGIVRRSSRAARLTGARRVYGAEGRNLAVEAGGGDPFVKLKLGDQEVSPSSSSAASAHAVRLMDDMDWGSSESAR